MSGGNLPVQGELSPFQEKKLAEKRAWDGFFGSKELCPQESREQFSNETLSINSFLETPP